MFRVSLGKPNCDFDKFSSGLTEPHALPQRLPIPWTSSVPRGEGRLPLWIELEVSYHLYLDIPKKPKGGHPRP
jgi:hypothetical protein